MSILQQLLNSAPDDIAFDKAIAELFTRGQLYQELHLACKDAQQLDALNQIAPALFAYLRQQEQLAQNQSRPVDEQRIQNCACPVCQGRPLLFHQRRLFLLAMRVLHAHIHLREGRLLHANRALLRAARMLNPLIRAVQDAAQISVLARTVDLRRALHSPRDCPALNLIEELLYYYEHGSWLPATRTAHTTCLFVASGSRGAPAKLVQERVLESDAAGLTPGYYPHPELLLTVCIEQQFGSQFARAWQLCAQETLRAVRWDFAPFRNEGEVWRGSILQGTSAGAAVAVGLTCLLSEPSTPPDPDLAFTGEISENGHLTSVGGYLPKADVFNKYPSLRLVCPQVDAPRLRSQMPDFTDRLLPAETVQEAVRHATRIPQLLQEYLRKTTNDLNQIFWANLTLEQVFVEPRLQRRKSAHQRRQSEQQSGAEYLAREAFPTRDNWEEDQARLYELLPLGSEYLAREAFPTRDNWEEDQARLYELLPLGSEYITETVRWKPFTTAVLSANARQALVGAPGSGKTTATKALARQLAQEALQQMAQGADLRTLRLPLWVRLSEVKLNADAPLDALLTAAGVPDGLRAFYREMLQSGRVVVFLDGLDELDETREIEFKRWLQALLEAIGSTPVLLTCRTLPWEQGGRKEWAEALRMQEPYELALLNLQEQRAFVQKFFANDIHKQSDLLRKIDSSFAMRHAARTYLMLTLIALLHKDEDSQEQLHDGNLTLAGIYRQVLRKILSGVWKEDSTSILPAYRNEEAENVLLILEKVCFCLLARISANKFSYRSWEQLVSRFRNPLELLTSLKAVGLIIETGEEAGELWYSFVHFSFMEYLAGAYLASRKDEQEFWKEVVLGKNPRAKGARSKRDRSSFVAECDEADFELPSDGWLWYKPEYTETLLFFASALQDATPLIDAIEAYEKETGGDDIFRQLLIHKARIVAFASVETERRRRIIDEVYHCWLTAVRAFGIEYRFPSSESEQSTSVKTRYHPLAMLVESANSENLMRSPVPPLRYLAPAVRVIGHEFIERFVKAPQFTGDLNSHLALCEAIVLTGYSSPRILSYLNNCLQMLIHQENPVMQSMRQRPPEVGNFEKSTLRALAKVADSSTISILLTNSLSQNSSQPLQYLFEVCNDSHVPALINALYAPEPDMDLIELSLRTIYYNKLKIEKNEKLVERLETYSRSEDIPLQVRLRAMQCLSRLEASRAIPLLINFIDTVSEPSLQHLAEQTLIELRSPEVANYLRRLIGMAGEEPTVYPHHYGAINNDDYTIARIASALIKMGMNDVLNHIINKRLPNGANYQPEHSETDLYLSDARLARTYEIDELLIKVSPYEDLLREYGNVQAVQKMMDIFPQEILDTGLTLAEARERWKRDFPSRILWLDTAVRICIQILARTPREEIPSTIVHRLLRLILVRQFVFLANFDDFAKIGEPALDALKYEAEEAERSRDWELCAMLIHAIGETRSLHAFEFLKQRLQHPNGRIRAAACEAIGKLERLHRVDREEALQELKNRLWDYTCAVQASLSIASIGTKHNIESLLEVARKKNRIYNFVSLISSFVQMAAIYTMYFYALSLPGNRIGAAALSVSPIAILGIFLLGVYLSYRYLVIIPISFRYELVKNLLLPIFTISLIAMHKLYISWYPSQPVGYAFLIVSLGLSCVISPLFLLFLIPGAIVAFILHYSNWALALTIAKIARTEAVPLDQKTRGFLLWLIRDIWLYPSLGYETFWSVSSLLRVPFRRRGLRRLYAAIGRMFQFMRRAFAAMFRRLPR